MDLPNQNPFMQEQMPMTNMAPSMTGHPMPTLGPYPGLYGQGSGSRLPTPDEDQDDSRENKRRNID